MLEEAHDPAMPDLDAPPPTGRESTVSMQDIPLSPGPDDMDQPAADFPVTTAAVAAISPPGGVTAAAAMPPAMPPVAQSAADPSLPPAAAGAAPPPGVEGVDANGVRESTVMITVSPHHLYPGLPHGMCCCAPLHSNPQPPTPNTTSGAGAIAFHPSTSRLLPTSRTPCAYSPTVACAHSS